MDELKTCGDCIHADLCKKIHGSWFSRGNIAECTEFKDEADFVPVQNWIPVTERLPDKFGEYIVAVQAWEEDVGNLYTDYADYDPYIRIWRAGYGLGERDKITHWMPLPPAPKGE